MVRFNNGAPIHRRKIRDIKTHVMFAWYILNNQIPCCRFCSKTDHAQMTSKCGKNKKVPHEPQASVSLMFLPQIVSSLAGHGHRPITAREVFSALNKNM